MDHAFRKTFLSAFAVVGLFAGSAQAVPISYQGVLIPNLPSSGSVGGFSWFLGQAAGVDFWSFSAAAGTDITLKVDRLNANLDPALSLYRGTTTADTSSYSSDASFGGMTFIGSLDDEAPPFLQPGPSGDPLGTFHLTTGGTYTVAVGGNGSTDAGNYPYRILLSVAAVPEPAVYSLFVVGLAALASMRRRASRLSTHGFGCGAEATGAVS